MAARCRVNGLEGSQPSLLSFLQAMVVTWYQSILRCFLRGEQCPRKQLGKRSSCHLHSKCPFLAHPPIQSESSGWACPVQYLRTWQLDASPGPVPPSGGKQVDGAWWLLKLTSHWPEGARRVHQHQGPPGAVWDTHWAGPLVMLCVIPLPTQLQSPPGIPMSSASCPVYHQTV